MGARHSKRSMDVTTTPKKESLPAEGADAAAVGDGKLERIEEADVKPTTNGVTPHTDTSEDKDAKDKDATTEKDEKKETKENEEPTVDGTKAETPVETPTEGGDATTPIEGTPASPTSVTSPDTKESKKKEKSKKKWSFRTISFGKKDKTKPVREDTPKNGDVNKEEPLPEGGEETETVEATSPAEDKSAVASPTESEPPTTEVKEADIPIEETKIEPTTTTPAPTPLPDVNKEDDKIIKNIEVSLVEAEIVETMVEVTTNTQPIVTTSIIEMKTSEDFPSQFPSSPPPTPIDPSPIQQVAANANELAEALKLPAENDTNNCMNKLDTQVVAEIDELSNNEEIELVVSSEEGPVPVSNGIPIEVTEQIVELPEESKSIHELSEESKIIDDRIVEEIAIQQVDKIDDSVAVEDVEIVEEPYEDIPAPPSLNEIAADVDQDNRDLVVEEIPPPLPESPIPLPKASTDLLNFMSSQISDNPPLSEIIDCVASAHETIEECTARALPTQEIDGRMQLPELHEPVDFSKTENLLTPPRSPSPIPPQNESSLLKLNDNDSKELRIDTVTNNHTNNSEINHEERIAESNNVDIAKQLPLTNDIMMYQNVTEPETPVEKVSEATTESVEEAPKSPAPTETPAPAAPVITEDVASVTKAIEEIDINEKAVAAAVNENIESVNTNEIITDMNHQNNLSD